MRTIDLTTHVNSWGCAVHMEEPLENKRHILEWPIHGHYLPEIKVGDVLLCNSYPHTKTEFTVTEINYSSNPEDLFFGKVQFRQVIYPHKKGKKRWKF